MINMDNFSGTGPYVESLEKQLAELQETRFCTCVNSGTTAIFLALQVLSRGRRMRIGVHPMAPSMSYIPILQTGNEPVFIDTEYNNCFGFSQKELERYIKDKNIDGLLSVGMWDQAPYSQANLKAVEEGNIFHIEDISQTHLSKAGDRFVGRWGNVGCSSLHNNKLVSSGEGGYLISDQDGYLSEVAKIRQFGALSDSDVPSMNYKLSGAAAQYCLYNLTQIDQTLRTQRDKHTELVECLGNSGFLDPEEILQDSGWYNSSCYGLFLVLPSANEQEYIHQKLSDLGIVIDSLRYGTAPAYQKYDWMRRYAKSCPNAENVSGSMIALRIPKAHPDWENLIHATKML